jgi:hypothetical protein
MQDNDIKVNRRTLSPTHNVNATMVTPSQLAGISPITLRNSSSFTSAYLRDVVVVM